MSDAQLVGGGDLGEIPYLRPAAGGVLFQRRAQRLAALAPGHAAADYLELLSALCTAQRAAAGEIRLSPNGRDLPAARPLDISAPPPAEWRDALAALLRGLQQVPMPDPARQALRQLSEAGPGALDALGGRILRGELGLDDLARAPFAGAALQVSYALLASSLPLDAVPRADDAGCPVCGFPPVAGMVLADDKLRYLVCGLCGCEWHLTRLTCAACHEQAHVSYYAVEGGTGPAKAEACTGCGAYTKLLDVEKAPQLEPFADDLASLSLDLLMAERGLARHGRNLFLASASVPE